MKKLLWSIALLLAACSPASPPTPSVPAAAVPSAWSRVSARFIDNYFRTSPSFAVYSGRHEYDGQIGDLGADAIKSRDAWLHTARAEIAGVDTAGLTAIEKLERENLLVAIDSDLFWDEVAEYPFRNPTYYSGAVDPDVYLSRNYAPLGQRMQAYIAYARNVVAAAASISANLRTPMPKSYVEYGVAAYGGFADFYRHDVPGIFAGIQDADLQQQLKEADEAAAVAMDRLKAWFVAQRKSATQDFALGKDRFVQMLAATERVDLPLAQIEAAGRADLARNLAAVKTECATFDPGATPAACIDKVRAHKAGDNAVVDARAQLAGLKAFIVSHQVLSIPSPVDALVAEAPPYNRQNAAFISIPGTYDRGLPSIYNISPPDPKWTAAERAAYVPGKAILLFTSVHEVWPGHYLQHLHAQLQPSPVLSLWESTGLSEGWAHYSEQMMYDMGLGQGDAETHLGQLEEALLRDVRLISAIGMHTEGMTQAQSEKLFLTEAFQDPGDARQEAARGTYDPSYLVYTLGKLSINKLRDEWVAKQNPGEADPKAHWHEFHDRFLSYGGLPVSLIRQHMLGESEDQSSRSLL
ncbi:MAG TPA: DUF885 domain-containing protein [Steroidobacteraceae bacterium]|nr:DUF885 domain-containing protein [Steroidobacteraceae bacterium]